MAFLTRNRVELASFAVVIGLASLLGVDSVSQALARDGCTSESVAGEYALQASGLTEALTHTTSDLGRFVVDGSGRLSGQVTVSVNGRIVQDQALRGTYSVQPDCTGSETFTIGADPTQRHADFVIADQGREIVFLETDSGTVFTGTATRQ
jgi:hypothetical protein